MFGSLQAGGKKGTNYRVCFPESGLKFPMEKILYLSKEYAHGFVKVVILAKAGIQFLILFVIPAKAGIQFLILFVIPVLFVIPAKAGIQHNYKDINKQSSMG